MRGLVEISNYCVRLCGYCGLRAGNLGLERYRMSDEEIMACVRKAVSTVLLKSLSLGTGAEGREKSMTPLSMFSRRVDSSAMILALRETRSVFSGFFKMAR